MAKTTVRGPHKFNPKRLSVRLLCLLAVVALSVLVKGLFFSPLPRGAYSVLSTARWTGRTSLATDPYQWLPNGDLAYLATDLHGIQRVCYQKMDSRGPVGSAQPGPELPLASHYDGFFPSPDEQWVAYGEFSKPGNARTYLVSADGKSTRSWKGQFMGWLADSRSYLSNDSPNGLGTVVCHLDSSKTEGVPRCNGGERYFPLTMPSTDPSFIIGATYQNAVPRPGGSWGSRRIEIRSYPAVHPQVGMQKWQVNLPLGVNDVNTTLVRPAPDGRHLLWDVMQEYTSLWDKCLHRLNPTQPQTSSIEKLYFVSDLHGGHLHPVLTSVTGHPLWLAPTWTPDSKHLSFIYQDQLYLVPID